MKKFLLIAFLSFISIMSFTQNGKWKVCVSKKTILEASKEDETKNIKTVPAKYWKKNGTLDVLFTETDKDIWFYRHLSAYDKDDNELFRQDSTNSVKISLKELKEKLAGKKEIFIYTTISPKDPNIAIRVRRVHLCTLRVP